MRKKALSLKSETIRTLTVREMQTEVIGGISGERCSIVYNCSDNTSIVRSCSGCTGSGTA